MTNNIKNYIEQNIETLDSNLIQFFIEAAYDLGEYEMRELISALKSAGIEIEIYRKAALEYNIMYMFSDWVNSGGEVCFLKPFLNENLNSSLGFTMDEIIQYLIDNMDKFNSITIEQSYGNYLLCAKR